MVGTVHDSDHEGLVRIFVCHSYHSNELFILYIMRHNFSPTRSVISMYKNGVVRMFFDWGSVYTVPGWGRGAPLNQEVAYAAL